MQSQTIMYYFSLIKLAKKNFNYYTQHEQVNSAKQHTHTAKGLCFNSFGKQFDNSYENCRMYTKIFTAGYLMVAENGKQPKWIIVRYPILTRQFNICVMGRKGGSGMRTFIQMQVLGLSSYYNILNHSQCCS